MRMAHAARLAGCLIKLVKGHLSLGKSLATKMHYTCSETSVVMSDDLIVIRQSVFINFMGVGKVEQKGPLATIGSIIMDPMEPLEMIHSL